jgi:hypothetical protein
MGRVLGKEMEMDVWVEGDGRGMIWSGGCCGVRKECGDLGGVTDIEKIAADAMVMGMVSSAQCEISINGEGSWCTIAERSWG